jgi:dihydroflavonol-4-reductase
MVRDVASAVGRKGRVPNVPLWPFDLAAMIFETTMPPLGLRPPLHRRRLDFFRKSFRFSTAKSERLLGFRAQVPFAEGTKRTAEWYRAKGFL